MVVEIKVDVTGVQHPLVQIFGIDGTIDHLYQLRAEMEGKSHEERVAILGQPQYRGLIPAMATANYQRAGEQAITARELTSGILHHPKVGDLPGNFSGLSFIPLHHFRSAIDDFTAHSGISPQVVEGIKRKAAGIVREHPEGFRCYAFLQLRKAKFEQFDNALLATSVHLVMFVVSVDGKVIKKFDALHNPTTLVPGMKDAKERVARCYATPLDVEPLEPITKFQKVMGRNDARAGRPGWVVMGEATIPDHRHLMAAIDRKGWWTDHVVGLDVTEEEAIDLMTLALFGPEALAEFEVPTLSTHRMETNCINMFGGILDKSATACCQPINDVLAAILDRSTEWFQAKGETTTFEQFFDAALRAENFLEIGKDQCVKAVQVTFESKGMGVCRDATVSCYLQSFVMPAEVIPGHDDLYAFFVEVEIEELRRILAFLRSEEGALAIARVRERLEDPEASAEKFDVDTLPPRAADFLSLIERKRAFKDSLRTLGRN